MSILAVVSKQTRVLQWRSLCVDPDHHAILAAGTKIAASPAEFALLRLLLCNRNIPMAKGGLLQALFGADHGRDDRQIDVFVARLRRTLSAAGLGEVIAAVPGRGYAILDDAAETGTADQPPPHDCQVYLAA